MRALCLCEVYTSTTFEHIFPIFLHGIRAWQAKESSCNSPHVKEKQRHKKNIFLYFAIVDHATIPRATTNNNLISRQGPVDWKRSSSKMKKFEMKNEENEKIGDKKFFLNNKIENFKNGKKLKI